MDVLKSIEAFNFEILYIVFWREYFINKIFTPIKRNDHVAFNYSMYEGGCSF